MRKQWEWEEECQWVTNIKEYKKIPLFSRGFFVTVKSQFQVCSFLTQYGEKVMAGQISSLGVDIGGVIINHDADKDGIYHPLPGGFETIRRLKDEKFGEQLFIISHAPPELEDKMLWWLWKRDFFKKVGITDFDRQVHFCRERNEKAKICLELGVTHFIDDRKEVLTHLHAVNIPNLYLFQERKEEEGKFMEILPHVIPVVSWDQVAQKLLALNPSI